MIGGDGGTSLSAYVRERGLWFLAAVILLAGLTLYTRGTAPWQEALTNDEMLHLESWRNRFRTDNIYPIFLEKAERRGLLEGKRLEVVERAYNSSTLFQRGLLVLVDVHPPTFQVLAQVLEALTHSSLTTVRLVSAIASALAVLFAYRLGRELRDSSLGLWLGTLFAIGFLAQVHAGIARPYTLTHFALILALYAFVRDEVLHHRSPWRFLLASLFAQSTDWPVWAIIFPLVVVMVIRRSRRDGWGTLIKRTWWYAALSVSMLTILPVHVATGAVGYHLAERPLISAWFCHGLASPFASLDWVLSIEPGSLLSPATILLLFLVIAGVGCVVAEPAFFTEAPGSGFGLPSVRVGFLAALVVSVALSVWGARGHVEMILILAVVLTVFAGAGLHWLLRTERASRIAVVATLVIFTVIRVGWPEDPRERALLDTDYAAVAQRIQTELGPDDIWTAFPRNRADCLYRYGPLPDPVLPLTTSDFREFIETLPRSDSAVLVFARMDVIQEHRILRTASAHWAFVNGFLVVKVSRWRRPPGRAPVGQQREEVQDADDVVAVNVADAVVFQNSAYRQLVHLRAVDVPVDQVWSAECRTPGKEECWDAEHSSADDARGACWLRERAAARPHRVSQGRESPPAGAARP